VWDVLLTVEERRLLGVDFETAYRGGSAVRWWVRLRQVSVDRLCLAPERIRLFERTARGDQSLPASGPWAYLMSFSMSALIAFPQMS